MQDDPTVLIENAKRSREATALTYVILVCCLVNIFLMTWGIYVIYVTSKPPSILRASKLRLQDSYVNLESVYRHSPPKPFQYSPIINHSRYFVQVSSLEPSRVLPFNETLLLHDNGMLPYYTRRLLVNSTASMILMLCVSAGG